MCDSRHSARKSLPATTRPPGPTISTSPMILTARAIFARHLLEPPQRPGVQSTNRCVALRTSTRVILQSRQQRSLSQYVPEITEVLTGLPTRSFLMASWSSAATAESTSLRSSVDFSRGNAAQHGLPGQIPACYLIFDLLAQDERDRRPQP